MTFRVHVEHEIIDGETVLETFDGVSSVNDPPMVDDIHLKFADGEMEKLKYGRLVRAVDETNNE